MLEGLIGGLIIAWILTLFNFDMVCMTALKELINVSISKSTYYFMFAMIGLITGALRERK